MNSANSLQKAWQQYRDGVYPDGIGAQQKIECHQAFFAGALVVCSFLKTVSSLPDDQAERALDFIIREAEEVCRARTKTLEDRN